jgi:ankyrin repeat protein
MLQLGRKDFGYYYNIPNVTRLHIAASFGLVEIAQLLLDEGADVEAQHFTGQLRMDTKRWYDYYWREELT